MTAPAVAAALPLDATAPGPELRRRTWSLAWPVIFSFSIEALVGLFDLLMVGRLGATAVAGVGVGIQIMGAVDATLFAVGTGALAIVARHVGAADRRAAEEALRQSIVAAAVLSVLAAVPVFVAAPTIIRAFHVDEAVIAAGTPFLRIVVLGVPAAAVLFVVVATLRGAGDTRTPLAVGAVVGALNVGLAYVLIFGRFGMPVLGVAGAATATVLAFASGATLGVTLLVRGGLVLRLRLRPLRVRPDVVRRVLAIGVPAAVEHLLMQFGFFLYLVFAAHHGTAPVAAYFIGARILSLSFLPGFGFGAAAATMVGQSLGAGRPDDAERSGRAAVRLALGLMTAAGAVVFIAARPIARRFVDDEAVVADAFSFIRVLAAAQPLMAIDFSLGGALRGAGDTRYPLLTVILGFYVCRLGVAYLVTFTLALSVLWLWLAVLGDYAARAALKARRFRSGAWKRVRV